MSGHEIPVALIATAFVPPILYLAIVRRMERWDREPWSRLLRVFFYGAIISVLYAGFLNVVLGTGLVRAYQIEDEFYQLLLVAVIVAPIVEETTKALGVRVGKPSIRELEDGIVYGVAAGLGFAATENLLYEYVAWQEGGTEAFLAVAFVRSITGTFLHATATGLVGYAMARRYLQRTMGIEMVSYWALAVLLHASFNLIASIQLSAAVGYLVLISVVAIWWTMRRIRHLDTESYGRS